MTVSLITGVSRAHGLGFAVAAQLASWAST